MRSEGAARHFIFAFLLAVVGYAVVYHVIEHHRVRKGPWRVTFQKAGTAPPELLISQPSLHIEDVRLILPAESAGPTNLNRTLVFDQPRAVPYEVPFGQCVFMDTTFLPGTLTFRMSGHEIELLPRVLVLDRQEVPWASGSTMNLGTQGHARSH